MTADPPPAAPSDQPPRLPTRPAQGWDRYPRWFIAAIITGAALVLTALTLGVVVVVIGTIKSSDAYGNALERVRRDPAVAAVLGAPLAEGFFVTGNLNVSGPTGRAELKIPISGPKGGATLYVEATKRLGEWQFDHLIVQVAATRKRLDLLAAPVATPRPGGTHPPPRAK